jgi:aspartate racemase
MLNPAQAIVEQLLKLEQIGATVAGIPCNTAHAAAIFDPIIKGLQDVGSELKLLHMITEVGRELRTTHPKIKKVGVLSTTGTAVTRIYPLALEPLGYEVLNVDETLQTQAVHPAIYHSDYGIKACGGGSEKARADLLRGASQLRAKGAQALILGCTEIPLAIREKQIDGMIVVDPALILARSLIRIIDPSRLVP